MAHYVPSPHLDHDCTFALTDAAPFRVNVQVVVLLPPLSAAAYNLVRLRHC